MDGHHAIAQLKTSREIDLVFSDIIMPGGLSGYDLAAQVREEYPHVKILLTSGYSQGAADVSGSHKVDHEFLRKPYRLSELLQRIRVTLDAPDTCQKTSPAPEPPTPVWTDDLTIGIDILDDDHNLLLQLIRHGSEVLLSDNGMSKADFFLKELIAYCKSHFEREEIVLQACEYPEAGNHARVHELLLTQLQDLRLRCQQGSLAFTDIQAFLDSWWTDHVLIMDRVFIPYLKGKEEQIATALERYFLKESLEFSE